jgi:hypothetical protein
MILMGWNSQRLAVTMRAGRVACTVCAMAQGVGVVPRIAGTTSVITGTMIEITAT